MKSKEVRWNKKFDNRGAAIAITIVAISVISVLAILALWVAYMNYYMKVADMRSTDTFYSAESVIEQMRTGLQNEISYASGDAYKTVLQRYAEMTEEERKNEFMNRVSEALMRSLMGSDTNHYNLKKLCEYVPTTDYAPLTYSHLGDDNETSYELNVADDETADVSSKTGCILERNLTDGTMILRDVNVLYTNKLGYVSVINTDFRLQIPDVEFGDTAAIPDLFKFTIIADQHLKNVIGSGGTTVFTGSVYGGDGEYDRTAGVRVDPDDSEDADNGIIIDGPADWTFKDAVYLVSGKTLKMHRGAKLTVDPSSALWADNIAMGGGRETAPAYTTKEDNGMELNLLGSSFVADDTSIEGRDCKLKLADSYYGYGNGAEDDDEEHDHGYESGTASSAILVNGQDATIDMSTLDNLLLGGTSYIGTRKIDLPSGMDASLVTHKNLNVAMGDSIAVRGNQIAYLVPAEALPLLPANKKKNPVSKKDYEAYILNHEADEVDLNVTMTGTDRPLTDFATGYTKVFAQGINDYLVYYYMKMTPEMAAEYFETYYGVESNKVNLDKYMRKYLLKDMQMADEAGFTKLDLKGNWMTIAGDRPEGTDPDNRELTLHRAMDLTGESTADSANSNYGSIFSALKATLTPSATTEQKSRRAFDNWVRADFIAAHFMTGAREVFETEDGFRGILTTEDSYTVENNPKTRLVISTGDVFVDHDFKGTIIAAGEVIVESGVSSIGTDSDSMEEVLDVLQEEKSGRHFYEYLVDGDRFKKSEEEESSEEGETRLSELVSYENWTKR